MHSCAEDWRLRPEVENMLWRMVARLRQGSEVQALGNSECLDPKKNFRIIEIAQKVAI